MFIEVTVGCSSSGKSTYAESVVKNYRGQIVEVNRDSIRRSLFNIKSWSQYKFSKENEQMVTEVCSTMIKTAIDHGKSVIVSDTNLNPVYRKKFADIAEQHEYEYREIWFDVSLDELKARNAKRGGWKIQVERLEQMFESFKEQYDPSIHTSYVPDFEEDGRQYTGTPGKPNAVIFDTDGTIAKMVNRGPFEWDRVGEDLPKYNVINHALDLRNRGIKIINVSGRDGCCKQATADWYKKVGMPNDDHFQRAEKDQRSDDIIKSEIFWRDIAPNYNVMYCVDDRNKVVDMWRAMGLECWQCQAGDF